MAEPLAPSSQPLRWVTTMKAGETYIRFSGEINENVDFSELLHIVSADLVFDLEEVSRINSCGVREWVNFLRTLEPVRLRFSRCSPAVVLQLNTIYNFRGRAQVVSFLAPYVCESCHADEYCLLEVARDFPDRTKLRAPACVCDRCGQVMRFDDLEERYFSFLTEEQL